MARMPAPETSAEFLQVVRQSGLVEADRLDQYEESIADGKIESARALSNQMIEDGLITHLQTNLLRKGKTKNFVICGKYKLLEHVGSGGMGQVFLCEHMKMGRRVAVK